jgi:hypothetical protein
MSTYEKPTQASMLGMSSTIPHSGDQFGSLACFQFLTIHPDFHTTTTLHDPSAFAAYAQPPYAPHFVFPSNPDVDHLHYVNGSDYRPQPSFEQRPAVNDPRTRPEITSYTPQEGPEGSTIHVYLQTLHDLLTPPTLSISLQFYSKRVDCMIQLLSDTSELVKQYAVSAQVPAFISTGYHSFSVPLRLVMDGGHGNGAPQAIEVGSFKYSGQVAQPSQPRKRKASTDSDEISQPLPKKLPTQQLRLQDGESFNYSQSTTSPYSPFLSTPASAATYTGHQAPSPRPGHHYSTSTASQVSMTAPSPHTPTWSPSFTTVNKASHSPAPPMTPATRQSATASPAKPVNPTLMRTSTIQQSPGAVGSATALGQSFNPYSMYPLKAMLKLNGDLDAMAERWSVEEFEARRRLVQFTRRQNGSTIHADFKSIVPEDRPPNSITISCIWWEEKKECFVTSVDTIFLLESLVAVRFTVEEKNRIRRNLEGFRPLTVSKSKAESEDFFKTIMGFPNPKPRNIEKDVKVFPWKILAHALKKIISKYSASYSSTASAILTPASSTYTSTEASMDHHSPPMLDVITTSATYPNNTISYSPQTTQGRMSAPITAGPTDLRLQMPAYLMPPNYAFQAMQQVSVAHSQGQMTQAMSAPVTRVPSWDFSSFVDTSPTSVHGGMHNMSYHHMPPTTYSMAPPSSGI